MNYSRLLKLTIAGLSAALAVVAAPSPASAIEQFPGYLQEAAQLPCAPSCTICHTTNPGMAGTWAGKAFGRDMRGKGATKDAGEAGIKKAFESYKADATKAAGLARLVAGQDPDTGSELCQITYGCGAHIAKDAPRDDWSGLLFVAGAMGFGALLRRTKRR